VVRADSPWNWLCANPAPLLRTGAVDSRDSPQGAGDVLRDLLDLVAQASTGPGGEHLHAVTDIGAQPAPARFGGLPGFLHQFRFGPGPAPAFLDGPVELIVVLPRGKDHQPRPGALDRLAFPRCRRLRSCRPDLAQQFLVVLTADTPAEVTADPDVELPTDPERVVASAKSLIEAQRELHAKMIMAYLWSSFSSSMAYVRLMIGRLRQATIGLTEQERSPGRAR
jgi:hypothetical protein